MNRIHLILVASLLCSPSLFSQSRDDDWLSLSRLSLSVQTSYHFNPWKNYNHAMETVARSVRENPFFIEPRGYYEKVQGMGTVEALTSYRVYEGIHLVVSGGYGKLDAGMEFYPEPAALPSNRRSLAFRQQLSYRQQTYGIGAQYEIPFSDKLLLTAGAVVEYYDADLGLSWRHNRNASGPLGENEGEHLQADLATTTYGATLSVGAVYHLWGPVQFAGQVRYRMATLKNFEGSAAFTSFGGFKRPFTAELVEAPNYFGVGVKEQPADLTMWVFLPPLTFLTEPDERARVPASINLSSFGVSGGIIVRF